MSQLKICLVTPSYAPDFERCQLLVKSISVYNQSPFQHYIIVDKQDLSLFKKLENPQTKIIAKEELLPNWIIKIPFLSKKNFWFSWKTLPIRGWLIQQLIKLGIAQYVTEDVLVFADSDVFFVKKFNLNDFIKDEQVRFFIQPNQVNLDSPHLPQWYYEASTLLDLKEPSFPVANYMGQLIFWRRDNVLKLHRYLEQKNNQPWIETLCRNWNVSEYILYGVFVEKILKQKSGHYFDSCDLCHNYWQKEFLEPAQLKNFLANIRTENIAVMLSAKANIPLTDYHQFVLSGS